MQNLSSLKNQRCLCSNIQNAIIIKGLIVDKNNYYNDPHTTCSSQVIITLEYSNPQVNFLSQGIK